MHKLDLKKVEEPDIKLLTSMIQHLLDHKKSKVIKKKKKTSTSVSLTTLKPLTMWITANYRIFLMIWESVSQFSPSVVSDS